MSLPRFSLSRFLRLSAARPIFGQSGREGRFLISASVLHLLVASFLISIAGVNAKAATVASADADLITVKPAPYDHALRNPLKGITSRNLGDHKWATLAHHYIAWDEIETKESDGVEKIRAFCDAKWQGFAARNVKIVPRVYLDYPGQPTKRWPGGLKAEDYESPEFTRRLAKLAAKLGAAWDNDPRVAFVELGIFGKWGEHHSPEPSVAVQQLTADAFKKAFRHKLVSVRQVWAHFPGSGFGEYWDSFAHYDQMRDNGGAIVALNESARLYEKNYIGGEVAYDWGHWKIQPGESPTETLAVQAHRDFMVNTIRWVHATQIRWIGDYDFDNAAAEAGAEEIQKVLGYRFVLEEARFSSRVANRGKLQVALHVKNVGSAPFYYDWPLEVSLLNPETRQVVWRETFAKTDIRTWLPGDGWTAPSWRKSAETNQEEAYWPALEECGWAKPAKTVVVSGTFAPKLPRGKYLLAVAILDPAGRLPSLRFATANYLAGGRHPLGVVGIDGETGGPLATDFVFDDPQRDDSLKYLVPASPTRTADSR